MRKFAIALALIGAMFATGCETLNLSAPSPTQTQTARIATKLGVQIGVLQYVGEDVQRAKRVKSGAETVKALLDDETTVSIYEVQAVVNELIDEFVAPKQTPQQVLLLKNAVTLVVADIELIIPTGVLDPATKERVNFYLDAVIEAVSLVIGPELASYPSGWGIDRHAAIKLTGDKRWSETVI